MYKASEIPEELKKEMLKHNKYVQESIAEHCNDAAAKYEDVYLTAGFHDPLKCAELAKDVLGDNCVSAKVMDFGCGTGLVGKYLKERGFTHIEGIDASSGMIEQARTKGAYHSLYEMFLGKPDSFPQDFHGKFDCITGSGILAEGHLDNSVFDEMLLALK